ncbi:hypothetical protein ACFXPM_15235 [Streptomyces sp. NPDC059095]|uniref:hypothetical protein n=1 Tax=Streptomyces sp. NPDC059095 TaxID=3346726 RepID=UPI0036CC802D
MPAGLPGGRTHSGASGTATDDPAAYSPVVKESRAACGATTGGRAAIVIGAVRARIP